MVIIGGILALFMYI